MKFGAIKYGTAYEYGKNYKPSEAVSVLDRPRVLSTFKVILNSVSIAQTFIIFRTSVLTLAESVLIVATFNSVGAFKFLCSSVVTAVDSIKRVTSARKTEVATIVGSMFKTTSAKKTETVTVIATFTIAAFFKKIFSEIVSLIDSTKRDYSTSKFETASIFSVLEKLSAPSPKTESLSVTEVKSFSVGKLALESTNVQDGIAKSFFRTVLEALSIDETYSRIVNYARTHTENVTVGLKWLAYLSGARVWLWWKVSKTAGNWIKSAKEQGAWTATANISGNWTKEPKQSGTWNSEPKDSTDGWNRTPNP